MELSYKQLERTLIGHFRIHPNREDTFRSRIKQLQRLGFPAGVNIGRGAKMEYSAAHLFQMATAFELIGVGFPAERATKLVGANWSCLQAAYGLSILNLNHHWQMKRSIFAWLLSRSFGDLQVEPYPNSQFPLGAHDLSARIAVGDEEGMKNQLLGRNSQRLAHCYALIPAADLTSQILKAAEGHGGVITARQDEEFVSWVPPKDVETGGWLFLSYDPWDETPTTASPAPWNKLTTGEIEERARLQDALARERTTPQHMEEALYHVAQGIIPALSETAKAAAVNEHLEDELDAGVVPGSVLDELSQHHLIICREDGWERTPIGYYVQDMLAEERFREVLIFPLRGEAARATDSRKKTSARRTALDEIMGKLGNAPFLSTLKPGEFYGPDGPDFALYIPGRRLIYIDGKFANEADPNPGALRRHVKRIRGSDYLGHGDLEEPNYVVLFVPSEAILSEALKADRALWEWAFDRRVLLATPKNLEAIVNAVRELWGLPAPELIKAEVTEGVD